MSSYDKNKQKEWQKDAPLAGAVQRHASQGRISFHVPGHKSSADSAAAEAAGEKAAACDLTELPGLDDLHHPEGAILDAEKRAARLFGAEQTFFLVNGTTSGVAAAIAACSTEQNTVILERSSHLSTSRGLILSGAVPCYIYNFFDREHCVPAGISAEDVRRALENCERPSAVVLTHPSYYGTYSDIRSIVDAAHEAGVPVIADEAHGAQLAFTGQDGIPPALEAGADISVQSTHKMLGSLTQSSMLHVQGSLVDRDRLRYFVSFMNSTSPSYLLMMSLDAVRAEMETSGKRIWHGVTDMVNDAKRELKRIDGLECLSFFTGADGRTHEVEGTRLIFSLWSAGLSGPRLNEALAARGIDLEFADIKNAAALAGAGSRASDFSALAKTLQFISEHSTGSVTEAEKTQLLRYTDTFSFRPSGILSPRKAVNSFHVSLYGKDAAGCVSAADISLYPPGVPVIRAGEKFTPEIIRFIEESAENGMEFHGLAGGDDGGRLRFRCAEDERDLKMMNGFF